MFSFEDLLELDRPFLPVSFKIRGKEVQVLARRLTAADQDALEAFYADEYARLVVGYTEAPAGKKSELEQVREIYATLTHSELVEQKLGSRAPWIQEEALKISGLTPAQIVKDRADIESGAYTETTLEEYDNQINEALHTATQQAKDSFRAEYDTWSSEELVDELAKVNINIKANNEARIAQNARRLFYVVYSEGVGENPPIRFFPSEASVLTLSRETIEQILFKVDKSFEESALLPFVSPAGQEPDGPAPLQSISVEVIKASGKPTKTPRKSSK